MAWRFSRPIQTSPNTPSILFGRIAFVRKPVIAGNWKMFKTAAEARAFAKDFRPSVAQLKDREIVLCAPYTALWALAEELKGSAIAVGAQNAHWEEKGAYTGEIAVGMLKEIGVRFVVVGHSERRQYFGETDLTVNKRTLAVLAGGLTSITCIGETLQEREANQTYKVLERQIREGLKNLPSPVSVVVAYEPVWAIGTGKTATPAQAQEAHAFIRKEFAKLYGDAAGQSVRILYGGSVKPENMASLMKEKDIDGGLVGGASLEPDSFAKIVLYDRQPVSSP
jgi:triosephosphate isomerase